MAARIDLQTELDIIEMRMQRGSSAKKTVDAFGITETSVHNIMKRWADVVAAAGVLK